MQDLTRARPDADSLKDWLFDFLDRCTGDPCSFFAILKRHGGDADARDPLTHIERDVAELFRGLIENLHSIMGSEESVIQWLRHSDAFRSVGASSPLTYLEEGDIWCVQMLSAVLKIWVDHPSDALGIKSETLNSHLAKHPELLRLFQAAFGSSSRPEEWFFEPSTGLAGARPVDALTQTGGVRQVCRYLAQIEAGVFI